MNECDEEYEQCEPDRDYLYDMVKDDFAVCDNEEEALRLIQQYPSMVRYLPKQYEHLLQYVKDKK